MAGSQYEVFSDYLLTTDVSPEFYQARFSLHEVWHCKRHLSFQNAATGIHGRWGCKTGGGVRKVPRCDLRTGHGWDLWNRSTQLCGRNLPTLSPNLTQGCLLVYLYFIWFYPFYYWIYLSNPGSEDWCHFCSWVHSWRKVRFLLVFETCIAPYVAWLFSTREVCSKSQIWESQSSLWS